MAMKMTALTIRNILGATFVFFVSCMVPLAIGLHHVNSRRVEIDRIIANGGQVSFGRYDSDVARALQSRYPKHSFRRLPIWQLLGDKAALFIALPANTAENELQETRSIFPESIVIISLGPDDGVE
jgi:hypothetical protein